MQYIENTKKFLYFYPAILIDKSYQTSIKIDENSKLSILSALQPLIIVLQVTGFAIFTINPSNFQADIKNFNKFFGLVTIIANLILHYIFWNSYYSFDEQGTEVAKSALPKMIYACVLVYTLGKILNFMNRQKIANFLKKFHEIDDRFKQLDITFDYKNDRKMIVKTLLGVCALALVVCVLGFCVTTTFLSNMDMSLSIFLFFGNASQFIITYQIIIYMIGIRCRYEAVNKFLGHQVEIEILEMKILAKIQLMIVESIEMFNSVYGPVNMMCVALVFGWHCLFTFMTLTMSSVMWTKYTLVCLFDILLHAILFSTVLIVIYYGELVKNEERKTIKLLYGALNETNCVFMKDQIQSMISQICDTKVEFSCGLVDFNWKFLFKVS